MVKRLSHSTVAYCVPTTCKVLSQLVRDSAPKGDERADMHTRHYVRLCVTKAFENGQISRVQSERKPDGLHGGGGM